MRCCVWTSPQEHTSWLQPRTGRESGHCVMQWLETTSAGGTHEACWKPPWPAQHLEPGPPCARCGSSSAASLHHDANAHTLGGLATTQLSVPQCTGHSSNAANRFEMCKPTALYAVRDEVASSYQSITTSKSSAFRPP